MANTELRFSAQFWPKGTSIRMINVPWDSAYKDIVQFDNEGARDAWLDNCYAAPMATNNMTYVGPGVISSLEQPGCLQPLVKSTFNSMFGRHGDLMPISRGPLWPKGMRP